MNNCWIFDFDGTLVDSEKHVRKTFLKITKDIAPEREDFAVKVVIGPPLEETAKEILGESNIKFLKKFTTNFTKMHDHEILNNTKPYCNSQQILKKLFKMGHKMAIATNKRKVPTIKLINHLGWNEFFLNIECSDSEKKIRSKIEMIEDLFKKDVDFKKALFVGDTIGDASAATKKNLKFIKANYGYGINQDWDNINIFQSIDKIEHILRYIKLV